MTTHPSAQIHPMAVVEPGAKIGPDCVIGPFAAIGAHVTLGAGVQVKSHAVVTGHTTIGDETVIFPAACVGEVPQDLKYKGELTYLTVGARCRIREGATLNTGTAGGGGITRVGDDCLIMTGAHVGHDAQLGHRIVLANQVAIAGHCLIGDDVVIGGLSGIHQFVRIGHGAMIGALTMVTADVIPFGLVQGPRGVLDGLNLIGLKRRGLDRADISALRAAYATLAGESGNLADRARALLAGEPAPQVRDVAEFILAASDRSLLPPK
jgi:UDP-N-acetylglucosamine acyltransferase